ncbi:MAG: glycerate kinase, partial [Limisphaerales bacterium]
MKVLIVPDKFKGTLTARAAAKSIGTGWEKIRSRDQLELLPMSDGGHDFGEIIGQLLGAKTQRIETVDAAHRPIETIWWRDFKNKIAIIDSAKIIGLAQLASNKFHPFELDTFGLGKVLQAADDSGAKKCLIGIGGSATNDSGFGMARALGWKFLDQDNFEIRDWWQLHKLAQIKNPQKPWPMKITIA